MKNVTMLGYKRVTKVVARELYESKQPVWLTNHKLRPANHYNWMCFNYQDSDYFCPETYTCMFEKLVSDWKWYNGNYDWGYYPAFYVKA